MSLFTAPSPAGGLLLLTLLVMCTGIATAIPRPESDSDGCSWRAVPDTAPDCWLDEAGTDAALVARMEPVAPRHRLITDDEFRAGWARDLHGAAMDAVVPPSLLVAIAYRESSITYRGPAGKLGELGPMQVSRWTVRTKRCDMSTRRGQIDCGARHLRWCADRCGEWQGAVSCYVTRGSKCVPPTAHVRWIVRDRIGEAKRLRRVVKGDTVS